jgi:hypothetical protein
MNQSTAIAAYAESHRMQVVQTYIDEERSGLDFGGRWAATAIKYVQLSNADYEAVLVYDVNRRGGLQNSNEAAYCASWRARHFHRWAHCPDIAGWRPLA